MRRDVFDTNVVVSALLFHASAPGRAFAQALDRGVILVSVPFLNELDDVLSRKKFDRYLSRQERDRFLVALTREAKLIEIATSIRACRDPKDDLILELAVNGDASCIVTGDADLLALHPFSGVQIVTPSEYLQSPV